MQSFDQKYEEWLQIIIKQEANPRRRGLLEKGLGHGTAEFLRTIWYPTVKIWTTCILNGRCVILTVAIAMWIWLIGQAV